MPWARQPDQAAGVMVKVPVPLQPEVAPDTVQFPAICPLVTVPFKVKVFTSDPVLMTT